MKIQAIFLSLVILVSLFISGVKFSSNHPVLEEAVLVAPHEENIEAPESQRSMAVFAKDLYSALSGKLSEKAILVGANLTAVNRNLSRNLNSIGHDFAVVSANVSENFSVAKESLAASIDNFFMNISKYTPGNPSNDSFLVSNTALTSKAEINGSEFMICDSEKLAFLGKAALVKYLDYNFNIFELNTEKRWPIASLSKLMTSLVAIEKMDLNQRVKMTETAVSTEGISGGFSSGEVFTVKDLIKAMLVVSSNDAAAAIAESFGKAELGSGEPRNSTELSLRGEKNFIDEMQKKAAELNMFQTTYLESTGLSFVNQSTAADLAKLMSYIYLNHPEILEISRQKETKITELSSGITRELVSINRFAGENDFIGGKTGYIEEADHNLIGFFKINGKTVLTITLGAEDSFAETQKLKDFVKTCQ